MHTIIEHVYVIHNDEIIGRKYRVVVFNPFWFNTASLNNLLLMPTLLKYTEGKLFISIFI